MPSKTPGKLSVDFSNVADRKEGGGRSAHVPEGDYLLQVQGCELKTKKDDDGSKYLNWKLAIAKPEKHKGAGVIYFVTSLKEEALWNLRNFLEDLGYKIPKSTVNIPIAKIVEEKKLVGATLQDDEYNDKVKSKVAATFKASAYEEQSGATGDDDGLSEDDADAPAVKTTTKAVKDEEDDDEDSSDDDDLEEIDVADL